TLALLLGALLGFLCWNFPQARIFMGDSGSLLIGLVLGVLTVRTTFLPPGRQWAGGWYAVFAPVIVLALPLYDLVVVSVIRLTRWAFFRCLALVIARACMLEFCRDPFPAAPGGEPVPRGPGAATSLILDLCCGIPAILILIRRVVDRTYRLQLAWAQLWFAL